MMIAASDVSPRPPPSRAFLETYGDDATDRRVLFPPPRTPLPTPPPSLHLSQVQPRLLFVLASDGLLPNSLAETDGQGVLRRATVVSGTVMVVFAVVVPFAALDDMVSAGVLLCFAITNSCAIVVRRWAWVSVWVVID